jgi:predicted short-subunit dehydrogenase-like oxidoreductase (DUF2520 family)
MNLTNCFNAECFAIPGLNSVKTVAAATLSHTRILLQVASADVIFLTVPDGAIETVAASLSKVLPSDLSSPRPKSVCHTSGALSSAVLGSVAAKGARTASLHPLQTFGAVC